MFWIHVQQFIINNTQVFIRLERSGILILNRKLFLIHDWHRLYFYHKSIDRKLATYVEWCISVLVHLIGDCSEVAYHCRRTRLLKNHQTFHSCIHRCRVTDMCVGVNTTIVSHNSSSPARRQAIMCTDDGWYLIGSLGTRFNDIWIKYKNIFKKTNLRISSAKRRPSRF